MYDELHIQYVLQALMLYLQGEILQHAISGTGIAGMEMWIKDNRAHLGTTYSCMLGGIFGGGVGNGLDWGQVEGSGREGHSETGQLFGAHRRRIPGNGRCVGPQ
jgi:hypothetical protein